MDVAVIDERLRSAFAGCQLEMASEGDRLDLLLIAADFEGVSKVKRQQMVYGVLGDLIKSGEIHALSMRVLTPAEQEAS
ncbi:MAG: BolA family protein [Pseudomonadales bacterium]